jgi:hypothetical protein
VIRAFYSTQFSAELDHADLSRISNVLAGNYNFSFEKGRNVLSAEDGIKLLNILAVDMQT